MASLVVKRLKGPWPDGLRKETGRGPISADVSTIFDGLSVDNTTGIVDQLRLPRCKAGTNCDNDVGVETWTRFRLNHNDYSDQGTFDAANNRFVAPVDGT